MSPIMDEDLSLLKSTIILSELNVIVNMSKKKKMITYMMA